jgi:hypothetical protein
MRRSANWRNCVAMMLALAFSPLSLCAPAVCVADCTSRHARVSLTLDSKEEKQSATRSQTSAPIHCHDEGGPSHKTNEACFRTATAVCRNYECAFARIREALSVSNSSYPAQNPLTAFQVPAALPRCVQWQNDLPVRFRIGLASPTISALAEILRI